MDSWTHGLADSQTHKHELTDSHPGNNFMAETLCFLPILHVQQLPNEPGTATGVVEEL